ITDSVNTAVMTGLLMKGSDKFIAWLGRDSIVAETSCDTIQSLKGDQRHGGSCDRNALQGQAPFPDHRCQSCRGGNRKIGEPRKEKPWPLARERYGRGSA